MSRVTPPQPKVAALYHVVRKHEGFEDAAQRLWGILRLAVEQHPRKPRHLYLDVEGHGVATGNLDEEMTELAFFIRHHLLQFLTEVHSCLVGDLRNPNPQSNDVPEVLTITNPGDPA